MAIQQYEDAEAMLPNGDLLTSIRGTDQAVHVGHLSARDGRRNHHWVAHMPDYEEGPEEFLIVRISTNVGSVTYLNLDDASQQLVPHEFYEYEEVVRTVVDIERTLILYKKERTVSVECPECERWGSTHPWKLDAYLPDVCECGYEGEWNVR